MSRIFLCLLLATGLLRADARLKLMDVRPSMEEIFTYHIEHKEMSPLLMRRAFKIYIEQFDPYHMHLLAKEVEPFLEPSNQMLQASLAHFQTGQLTEFIQLNLVIQKAVERSRTWRREIQKELVLNGVPQELSEADLSPGYAKTEEQLKLRIAKQLSRLLLEEKRMNHLTEWTPEVRAQIFQLWQTRLQRREEPYLILNPEGKFFEGGKAEGLFCLHTLRALAKSLDAHTTYFSSEEANEMRTSLEKQFEGVGVILREGINGVIIADLLKDGPAARSGKISIGDRLVEIDGKSLIGKLYEVVLEEMKGNGKQEIQLGLRHPGQEAIFHVTLMREKIVMKEERVQASSIPFAGGVIGKIILPSFYEGGHLPSAEQDMREAIKTLKKEGDLKGLILDMRDNAGGFLSQAVKIAGLFITRGVIVISKYSHGDMKYLRDIDGRVYFDGPLVILTSKGSASAAEIVAAALQDYGTAVIIGDDRTYGKGTIQFQTVTDENAKAFFKVTVGRYYTASGKSPQIEGVKADIRVPTELAPFNIGERFLEYPLPSDRIPPAFIDPLSDIDERNRAWFQRNYLPNLQVPVTIWQKWMPQLTRNSKLRLSRDKDFTLFLENLEQYQGLSPRSYARQMNPAWGNDDLQMAEAVNILKDMIQLAK